MADKIVASLDSIHQSMLNSIDDDYQKTQGFPTYDLTRGIAIGIEELENIAYDIAYKQDVDNLTGDDLDNFVEQRTGQTRTKAVKSIGEITILEGMANILEGDLFETESGIQFESAESKFVRVGDKLAIQAVVGGQASNVSANSINRMPITIQGLVRFTNEEPTHGGYDVETDEAYRDRYYEKLRTPVNGVNANTYVIRAKEVDGVLGARCIPIWNGVNTVKVVIIGSDYKPADTNIIEAVQDYIDPNKNGDGSGTAPIGAVTTVVSATPVKISVEITGLKLADYAHEDTVKQEIKNSVDRYIKSIVFKRDYVSVAKVGSVIMQVSGVDDCTNVTVNGGHVSIKIANDECPVLNGVTYAE